jgi:dihydroxyacetone kinase-like protein
MVTRDQIVQWLRNVSEILEEQKERLGRLDAAIGDGDHGINMSRGFRKVADVLSGSEDKDIGVILKATGLALISSVGGASGPLYGTLFLRAAQTARDKHNLNAEEVGALLRAGLDGVIQRGKAILGDKTMVDALNPAVETYTRSLDEGTDLGEALKLAADAAERGMKETIPLIARRGRASYLGERSRGHQDPGATSSCLIIKALHAVVTGKASWSES